MTIVRIDVHVKLPDFATYAALQRCLLPFWQRAGLHSFISERGYAITGAIEGSRVAGAALELDVARLRAFPGIIVRERVANGKRRFRILTENVIYKPENHRET